MNLKSLLKYVFFTLAISLSGELFSQNLLDTSSWLVGYGSVTGFNKSGTFEENVRELGINHKGDEVVLWKAVPDTNEIRDGGWDSDFITINNTNTYRLSVWIKKTHSHSGTTSFGTHSITGGNYNLLSLNDFPYPYPYFWNGDLPQLNRWYLLVGFVHNKDYSSSISHGKIYDGVTGEVVGNTTDFKFSTNAINLMHRSYLYGETNLYNRQYFWGPRIDLVDSTEPSIEVLLSISENPKLIFTYDNAGNQKQRFYCDVPGCSIPEPPAGRPTEEITEIKDEIADLEELEDDTNEIKVSLSPNPTKGSVLVRLNSHLDISLLHDVNIYNSGGVLVLTKPSQSKNELEIDLTNLSIGVYLVHIHLSNGTSFSKTIIKN